MDKIMILNFTKRYKVVLLFLLSLALLSGIFYGGWRYWKSKTELSEEQETSEISPRASDMLNLVMKFIGQNHLDVATLIEEDISWTRSDMDIRPGYSRTIYTGDGWTVTIGHGIGPERVYEIRAEYTKRIMWIGTVTDGRVSEDTIEVDPEIAPDAIPSRKPRDCPDLDSQLFQLTQADDPPALAEQLGFEVKDDKVQVLLILTSEEMGFLDDFGVDVGTQSTSQVQAFVPFDKLCELANTDAVLAIHPAAQLINLNDI